MNKFKTLWIAIILLAMGTAAAAQLPAVGDKFKVDDLYYEITKLSPREVKVVSQNTISPYWNEGQAPTGNVAIPASVTISPNSYSVTEIGGNAFNGSSGMTTLSVPSSVLAFHHTALNRCENLTAVNVDTANPNFMSEDGVVFNKAKTEVFRYPSAKSGLLYTVPSTVTKLDNSSFAGCDAVRIVLPEGLTWIDNNVFWGSNLASIEFPANVTVIGNNAFYGCTNLRSVIANMENPATVALGPTVFNGVPKGSDANACKLIVKPGKKSAYSTASQWSEFSPNIYELNMSKYITITANQGDSISLRLGGLADNTSIKIVSGSSEEFMVIRKKVVNSTPFYVKAIEPTITIYGDVDKFYINANAYKIKTISFVNNNLMKEIGLSGVVALTSIDLGVQNNLTSLTCNGANLTSLDLSGCAALQSLYCYNSQLTYLNLSGCTALRIISAGGNRLTSLDVRDLTELRTLYCHNNNFTTQALNHIYCALPTRGISDNAKICPLLNDSDPNYELVLLTNKQNATGKGWSVKYSENSETDIPATTGNYDCNTPLDTTSVTTNDAKDITPTSATLSGTVVVGTYDVITERGFEWKLTDGGIYDELVSSDKTNTFTVNLTGLTENTSYTFRAYVMVDGSKVYGKEKRFNAVNTPPAGTPVIAMTVTENATINISFYLPAAGTVWIETAPNVFIEETFTNSGWQYENYTATGTKLKVYGNITRFSCFNNGTKLTELDASGNTQLIDLNCSKNSLTELNVNGNTQLTFLYCANNSLTELNVSNNSQLTDLYCGYNSLTELNVSALTELTILSCEQNKNITTLDISNNTKITYLICYSCNLQNLNLTANVELVQLICNTNKLTGLDVSTNTKLTKLDCGWNPFTEGTSLNVSNNILLTRLICSSLGLTTLDITSLSKLTDLGIGNNKLDACALDKIYTDLPTVTTGYLYNDYNPGTAGSKTNIATDKGWTKNIIAGDGTGCSTYATITTSDVIAFNHNSATLGAVVVPSTEAIAERGIEWKKTDGGSYEKVVYTGSEDTFNVNIADLEASTSYTFRAYIVVGTEKRLGAEKTFTTNMSAPTAVTTNAATAISSISATLSGTIVQGTDLVTERGFEWKKTDGGTYKELKSTGTDNAYSEELTGLTANTNYTFKAYIKVGAETRYGDEMEFTTATTPPAGIPVIAMTVTENATITIGFKLETAGTVWIETAPGVYITETFTSGGWKDGKTYTVAGTSLKVHGNITMFSCSQNREKLTGLDLSGNTLLTYLNCNHNSLTTLNVSALTDLTELRCESNKITSLDVSQNIKLTSLECGDCKLTELDVSANTKLTLLRCFSNPITALDVSNNTLLETLNCASIRVPSLNISPLTKLKNLGISNNEMDACTLDKIYTDLPTVTSGILVNQYNPGTETSNTSIATAKGWTEYIIAGDGTGCSTVFATVTTSGATDITFNSATLGGAVVPGTEEIVERGFEWKLTDGGTYGDNDDLKSNDKTGTFTANLTELTANTSYTFRVYVKVGTDKVYGAEKTFTTSIGTGIDNITQTVSIYPNPAKDILDIKSDKAIESVELYDALGRKVLSESGASATEISINVSSLRAGIYVLKLFTVNGNDEIKVVVSK